MGRRRTLSVLLGALAMCVAGVSTAAAAPDHSGGPRSGDPTMGDPPFSVDLETLDAAVDCDPFTHPDTEPVLLVHGTTVRGHEHWDWNYAPYLRNSGRDVCIVTYPDRGLGDMQTSAEYVARAVQRIHAESERPVDIVGHSQGALMPRWAIKFWPSVRASVDDFVALAGPQHGAALASGIPPSDVPRPAVTFQFAAESQFLTALNAGDETPGEIDYTAIYTLLDELVRPVDPPTAAFAKGDGDANVVNISIQDLCPLRVVDHATIGTTDAFTMRLVLDALGKDGPTDVARMTIDEAACSIPDQYVAPDAIAALLRQFPEALRNGLPNLHLVTEEPPLRAYVPTAGDEPDGDSTAPGGETDVVDVDAAEDTSDTLRDEADDPDGSPVASPNEEADLGKPQSETGNVADVPGQDRPESAIDDEDAVNGNANGNGNDNDNDDSAEAADNQDGAVTAASKGRGTSLVARTGTAIPIVAAAIAVAVALLLRLGNSRQD